MIVNRSHFPARAGFSAVSKMNAQLQQLQVKLATGQKYSTLAEMGSTRSSSLSLNARLDRVAAYQSNIDTVSTRLSFLDNAMTRLDKIQSTARTSVAVGGYGTNNINLRRIDKIVIDPDCSPKSSRQQYRQNQQYKYQPAPT